MPLTRAPRRAFTLVEIIVVIAIIAVLAALTVAGVNYANNKAQDLAAQNDMTSLAGALTKFKAVYGIYPPGLIKLGSNHNSTHDDYPNANVQGSLDAVSLKFLYKMWPKLGQFSNISWDGSGNALPSGGVVLTGDQCLIFFLGGIPQWSGTKPAGLQGFGTNPLDPTYATNDRMGPFLSGYSASRLYRRTPTQANGSGNNFLSYYDAYSSPSDGVGNPYLYFSGSLLKLKNGYGDTVSNGQASLSQAILLTDPFNASYTVYPYLQAAGSYYSPDSYQLICAGRDQVFGPGGLWTAATAGSYDLPGANNPVHGNGQDDRTSIYGSLMGVPQ